MPIDTKGKAFSFNLRSLYDTLCYPSLTLKTVLRHITEMGRKRLNSPDSQHDALRRDRLVRVAMAVSGVVTRFATSITCSLLYSLENKTELGWL